MKQASLLLLVSLFITPVLAQQKNMVPGQEKLSVFTGHWTVQGSEETYLEVCNWMQGNHIRCISTSKEKTGIDSSTSYLSYSAIEKTYVYYGLYGSGNSRTLRGRWNTDRFIFEGQRVTKKETTRWKVTITPAGKNLHFVEEASVNTGPWTKKADFIYKRLK